MTRVIIIDDRQMLIDTLSIVISNEEDIDYFSGACTWEEGLPLIRDTQPDVLVLNADFDGGKVIDELPGVMKELPKMRVVIMTANTSEQMLMNAINQGVSGILTKDSSFSELIATIRKTAMGDVMMPSRLLISLLRRLPVERATTAQHGLPWKNLTNREREVLNFLAQGRSGPEIAHRLNIAPFTVRTHIRNLMGKLGVHTRLEAVAFGMKHGLVETDQHF